MRILVAVIVGAHLAAAIAFAQNPAVQKALTTMEKTHMALGLPLVEGSRQFQGDLNLSDEQRRLLEKHGKAKIDAKAAGRGGLGGKPGVDPAIRVAAEAHAAASKTAFLESLSPQQRQRLVQMEIQRVEVSAFRWPPIQDVLQLTDNQKKQIDQIQTDGIRKSRVVNVVLGMPPADRAAQMAVLADERMNEVAAILSSQQQAVWRELIGMRVNSYDMWAGIVTALSQWEKIPSQMPGGPARREGGDLDLIRDWFIQEELRLSDDQRNKVADGRDEFVNFHIEARKQQMARNRVRIQPGQPPVDPRKQMEEDDKLIRVEGDRIAKRILSVAQQDRLRQIAFQVDGLYTFTRADIQESLHLTEDQKAWVANLERDLNPPVVVTRGRAEVVLPAPEPTTAEEAAVQFKRQREYAGKVATLLTAEQRQIWETLVGPPFVPQR